jgi:hypothetical protein
MNIIICGSSGMVGRGVLLECLDSEDITSILVINRKSIDIIHEKLTEIIHSDFYDFSAIADDLVGYDAMFYAIGISSVGMDEDAYTKFTNDSIARYLFEVDEVDSLKTFQFALMYPKTYDLTLLNIDGYRMNVFFEKRFDFSDTLRSSLSYDITTHFDLDPEKQPENTIRDSIRLVTMLSSNPKLTDEDVSNIYMSMDSIYEFTYRYEHPNLRNRSFINAQMKLISDTDDQAEYLTNKLLSRYTFENSKDTVDYHSLVKDSMNLSFFQEIGYDISKQAKHLAQMDNAGKVIGNAFIDVLPKVIFLLLPIFAFILKLFYIKQKVFYLNHLIFALHTHSIFFIYMLIGVIVHVQVFYMVCIFGSWLHVFLSFRAVYNQGWILTFLKFMGITFVYNIFMAIGVLIGLAVAFFQV